MRAAVLAVVFALAVGCGKGKAASGGARSAADVYVTALAALRPIEDKANAALAAVTGDRYVDDDRLLHALTDEVVPRWQELEAGLTLLTPPPAAATAHARFLAAVRAEHASLRRIADALEHGDGTAVTIGNGEHRAARAELDAVAAELAAALVATPPR